MKKLFFVRSGSTCRMLRILAAVMLLLPVNLQPVRASRQDAGAKSSLTVKMKDATLSSVFAEVERTSRYAFIYTDDVRPLLDRRVSVSVRSATIDELLSAVLKGTELTGRVRESQVIISKAPARKNAAVTPPLPAANSGREIVLQGTVISSADNKPIVGVSVYVEGTTVGATSDINGNYTLKVPAGTKHVTFAFLGYDTKKIAVADVELFKLVTLIEASNVMDDVVVVAFGTQKKESLVGAVQVVRPSTLKVTSSNLSTSFAGKIAGVISTQSSGEPGADGANFWIRGISTFGANKSPLLILDGVADLCNDPNDLHESEALTCELMRWSSEYDNHILCVLHSNPGGEKARGHLGSALLRKSETVMLVKADGDTSVVSPQYCRNEPFTEFAFQINASGLPELCGIPAPQPKENVFAEIMEAGKVYAHSELIEMLMEAVDLKEGSAKSKISRAVKAGTIVKNQAGGYYLPGSQTEVSQPELHDEPF